MKKGFKQIELNEIIDRAGGKETLRGLGKDRAYDHMWKTFDHLAVEAFKSYDEIGEPDPTEMMDYLDNIIN